MLKKLMLLSTIASLSACSSYNEERQCDSDKNYIISNPQAIEEYKNNLARKNNKSFFYEIHPAKNCNLDSCMAFNSEKFDFIEKNFNDENGKGVYRIYMSKDLSRNDCVPHNKMATNLEIFCFYTQKNDSNKIYSQYKRTSKYEKEGFFLSVYDLKNNVELFSSYHQYYTNNAVGSNGGGICKTYKRNNDYIFNIFDIGINNN